MCKANISRYWILNIRYARDRNGVTSLDAKVLKCLLFHVLSCDVHVIPPVFQVLIQTRAFGKI